MKYKELHSYTQDQFEDLKQLMSETASRVLCAVFYVLCAMLRVINPVE